MQWILKFVNIKIQDFKQLFDTNYYVDMDNVNKKMDH